MRALQSNFQPSQNTQARSQTTSNTTYPLAGKYLATPGWSRLCLLLDYDGTLAPHGAHPDLTVLPPATKEVALSLFSMINCHHLYNDIPETRK